MKDISVALGGGGFKGVAHIGVLRSLEKAGYRIRSISGTSIGGLIGAVYAAGFNTIDLEMMVNNLNHSNLFNRAHGDGPSIMGLQGISDILVKTLGDLTFDKLVIPFACTSVDIDTGKEYILNSGRVADAVLATIAIPGVFPPKVMNGITLVDGATVDPVPVLLARWLMPNLPVVAVCLQPLPDEWQTMASPPLPISPYLPGVVVEQFSRMRIAQAFNIFTKSIDITSRMLAEARMKIEQPDVILRPDVSRFALLEIVDPQELILAGENVVVNTVQELDNACRFTSSFFRRLKPKNRPGELLNIIAQKESDKIEE